MRYTMSALESLPGAFSGAKYSWNAAHAGDKAPCVICGKAVTTATPLMVRVSLSNRIYTVDTELGEHDFGCFPIGRSCARRYGIRRSDSE